MRPFKDTLFDAMENQNVSGNELAKRLGGVSKSAEVRKWLSGRVKQPMMSTIARIADALGVSVGQLIGIEPLPDPAERTESEAARWKLQRAAREERSLNA